MHAATGGWMQPGLQDRWNAVCTCTQELNANQHRGHRSFRRQNVRDDLFGLDRCCMPAMNGHDSIHPCRVRTK